MNKQLTYKISFCALLSTLALIAFVLEGLFPPLILPGARMGLSNIFILIAIFTLGGRYAFAVLAVKTVLGSLFGGNISAVIYSLPSGLVALTAELFLIYVVKKVSVVAISVVGAVINVTMQNLTFCLVVGSTEYLLYLPYLALIGVVAGVVVGFATFLAVKKLPLPKKLFETKTLGEKDRSPIDDNNHTTNI